jgi:hypothetical protein
MTPSSMTARERGRDPRPPGQDLLDRRQRQEGRRQRGRHALDPLRRLEGPLEARLHGRPRQGQGLLQVPPLRAGRRDEDRPHLRRRGPEGRASPRSIAAPSSQPLGAAPAAGRPRLWHLRGEKHVSHQQGRRARVGRDGAAAAVPEAADANPDRRLRGCRQTCGVGDARIFGRDSTHVKLIQAGQSRPLPTPPGKHSWTSPPPAAGPGTCRWRRASRPPSSWPVLPRSRRFPWSCFAATPPPRGGSSCGSPATAGD